MIRSSLLTALISIGIGASAADTYEIDPVHSSAVFKVSHLNIVPFYGSFAEVTGTVLLDADAAKNSVNITIPADKVVTHNDKRDQHLRGPDFFNTKQFPTLTFVSTAWKKVDDKNFAVTGDLTIKGVTKSITVPVVATGTGQNPMNKKDEVGFEAQFSIKRGDYGITYGPGALGEDVAFTIAIEAAKK